VFVPETVGRYREMVERAQLAPQSDYCFGTSIDGARRGIWVPVDWYSSGRVTMPSIGQFVMPALAALICYSNLLGSN
jgi:hypothetical protein